MQVGIVFFSMAKKLQGRSKTKSAPNQYVLVSEDRALKGKLEQKLKKPVHLAKLINGKLSFSVKDQSEIILDNQYVSYKEALLFLEDHQNKPLTFKMHPVGTNFIIGSNSSQDRGEVITFSD